MAGNALQTLPLSHCCKVPNPIVECLDVVIMLSTSRSRDKDSTENVRNSRHFDNAVSKILTASVLNSTQMTSNECPKMVRSMRLKLEKPFDGPYMPGDSVSIFPEADGKHTAELIKLLRLDADSVCKLEVRAGQTKMGKVPAHLPTMCSVQDLFKHYIDIRRVIKKPLLVGLIRYTTEDEECERLKAWCSQSASRHLTNTLHKMHITITDILHAFPSCQPPLGLLVQHLTSLEPRPYSISTVSSQSSFDIVYGVEQWHNFQSPDRIEFGLCTSYLERLEEGAEIQCFLNKRDKFCPPSWTAEDVIMVATGTGLSPFIGFLENRRNLAGDAKRRCWLLYGCRHPKLDFIFQSELLAAVQDGVLDCLGLSFSQASDCEVAAWLESVVKVYGQSVADKLIISEAGQYVQRLLYRSEMCQDLIEMLMEGLVYVCGDGSKMGLDVKAAFVDCFEAAGKADRMATMISQGRYIEDIWV